MKQEAEAYDEWVGDILNPYFYQFIHLLSLNYLLLHQNHRRRLITHPPTSTAAVIAVSRRCFIFIFVHCFQRRGGM